MEITWGVWILSDIVLFSIFLVADEWVIPAKTLWIVKAAELNKPIYCKNILKMEVKRYVALKRLCLFSQKTKVCGWRWSGLIKEYLKILAADKELNLEKLQSTWCIFYLFKHKTKKKITLGWLVCTTQSILVLIHICMVPLKVYAFLEQGNLL